MSFRPTVCSRCMSTFDAPPLTTTSETECKACEPREASVFDYLYQFPRDERLNEVIRIGDWFVQPHETNMVAIHDDAWPTIYEDEKPDIVVEHENPKTVAHLNTMLFGEALYAMTMTLSKLRKAFVVESLLAMPPIRVFAPGIFVNSVHAQWLVEYAFAGLAGSKSVDVAFVEPGIIRFVCGQRIAVLARIETNQSSVGSIGVAEYEKSIADTQANLDF